MVWPPILWRIICDVRDIEYFLSRTHPIILVQLELLLLYLKCSHDEWQLLSTICQIVNQPQSTCRVLSPALRYVPLRELGSEAEL